MRPWLGLKMLDLNEMIVAQLKERDDSFPDVSRGVLVSMVSFSDSTYAFLEDYLSCLIRLQGLLVSLG